MELKSLTFTNQLGEVLIGAVITVYKEDGTTLLPNLYNNNEESITNTLITNNRGMVSFKLPNGAYVVKAAHALLTSTITVNFNYPFSVVYPLTEDVLLTKEHVGRYFRNQTNQSIDVIIPQTLAATISNGAEFYFKVAANGASILLAGSIGVTIDTPSLSVTPNQHKTLKLIDKVNNLYDFY